jgi:hypothetical protein
MTSRARYGFTCGLFLVIVGCGGTTGGTGDSTGTLGGSSSTGGASFGATGGAFVTSDGGAAPVCTWDPSCSPGDSPLTGTATCPSNWSCYPVRTCYGNMLCAHPLTDGTGGWNAGGSGAVGSGAVGNVSSIPISSGVGGASPAAGGSGAVGNTGNVATNPGGAPSINSCVKARCDDGDTLTNATCADTTNGCYTMGYCGLSITCTKPSVACDRAAQYNRSYTEADVSRCSSIKFECVAGTQPFSDSCGCGCEQPATCPRYVDCMPGGTSDPLCSNATSCPFTLRAL